MIFSPNRLPPRASVSVRADLLSLSDAQLTMCDNLRRSPAGLRTIGGFERLSAPPQVKRVLARLGETLYFHAEDGLYAATGEEVVALVNVTYDEMSAARFDDGVFVGGSKRNYWVKGASSQMMSVLPFKSVETACDRLFGLSYKNDLHVSPAAIHDDWRNAVTINLTTDCEAVVAAKSVLYVLGDVCYRYNSRALETDSELRVIGRGIGNVQRESTATLGGEAFFAADTGLYRLFDGKAERAFVKLDDLFNYEGAVACGWGGMWILSCKRLGSVGANDVTLLLDPASESVVGAFDFGFASLSCFGNVLYGVREGEAYRLVPHSGESVFKRTNIDMGSKNMKYLDKLTVRVSDDCVLCVTSKDATREYFVKGSPAAAEVKLFGCGEEFGVEVRSQNGLCLSELQLFAHTQRETV